MNWFNKLWIKFLVPTILLILSIIIAIIIIISSVVKENTEFTAQEEIKNELKHFHTSLALTNDLILEKVHLGMNALKSEAEYLGNPKIEGKIELLGDLIPKLVLGNTSITKNHNTVDKVKDVAGGTATIFVREGSKYISITSNVLLNDGTRAVGTVLDSKGKAIQEVNEGRAFYGMVNILGTPYLTGYEPMKDENNNIIGLWYTGYLLSSLEELIHLISESRILNDGFITLLDESNKVISHSNNYSKEKVEEILSNPNVDYIYKEQEFSEWGYKLIALASKKEIASKVESARNSIIYAGIFVTLVLISIFYGLVHILLLRPILKIQNTSEEFTKGNRKVRIYIKQKDEIGKLSIVLNALMDKSINLEVVEKQEKRALELAENAERMEQEANRQKEYLTEKTNLMLVEMTKLSEGDLNVHLTEEEESGEIKKLFNGFNTVVERINNMISELKSVVNTAVLKSNQISNATEEISRDTENQTVQISEIVSSIEQVTKTILSTTENISESSEMAKEAGEIAHNGGGVVDETIKGMNHISEVVNSAAKTIEELGKSTEKIDAIIKVINDIADQTNLLALNAAIEAARAGEHGRGFAVVADEVKKLSERTTVATKEIAFMINLIHTNTSGAVNSIKEGSNVVVKGKELASNAGTSLEEIITSANKVVDFTTQVAGASEEQATAAEQISKNIDGISTGTQKSAEGIKEIANASEELKDITNNIHYLLEQFKLQNNDILLNEKTYNKQPLFEMVK